MGIRFSCPNGHRLNVKTFLAGKRGICPDCGARFTIPQETVPGCEGRKRSNGVEGNPVKNPDPNSIFESAASTSHPDTNISSAIPVAEPIAVRENETMSPSHTRASQPTVDGQPAEPAQPDRTDQRSMHPIAPTCATATTGASTDTVVKSGQPEWFVQISDGQRFGPADTETILDWVRQGRVAPDNLVFQRGWAAWKTAEKVFPEFPEIDGVSGETPSSQLILDGRSSRTDKYRGRQAAKSRLFAIVATLGITSAALLATLIYVVRQ
jgi:hypothetical protein